MESRLFYALFFRAGTGDDSRADGQSSRQFCSQRGCGESIWNRISGFRPGDIEVLRDERGKPYVNLLRGAKEAAVSAGIVKIHVSITNTDCYAVAFAVGEGE